MHGVISFSGFLILMHGVISLSDVTSYDETSFENTEEPDQLASEEGYMQISVDPDQLASEDLFV